MKLPTHARIAAAALLCIGLPQLAQASAVYGTLSNFDVYNDSTTPYHGFEIELEYMEYGAYIQSIFVGKIPEGAVGLGPLIGSPRDPDNNFFSNFHTSAPRHNWGGTPIPEQAELDAA